MTVKKRPKTLASGRPPTSRPKERMTAERSRTIIRTHHRLQKQFSAALKEGDTVTAQELESAIEKNGGIKTYQAASKQGQAKDRGGDSSKVLVEWLRQLNIINESQAQAKLAKQPIRCLEVGALSTKNEISKFPNVIQMTRIDLNSQEPGIGKQDFMERPLPATDRDRFDIISLSLVLNYVPDAVGRGEMLKRLPKFLRLPPNVQSDALPTQPLLFFVLPLPCVSNSRYLDEELLLKIMDNLGFKKIRNRNSSKLCYYLFSLTGEMTPRKAKKAKVRDGATMNNFCIVVD